MNETYDAIDLLADADPIALRDLAWKLLGERDDYAARLKAADNDYRLLCIDRCAMLPVVEAAKAWADNSDSYAAQQALAAAVDTIRDSRITTPAETDCTCPWNNGYFPDPNSLGHHIACPSLTGRHTPDDDCVRTGVPMAGHRDA